MGFPSNIAAINAANASLRTAYLAAGSKLDNAALKQARALHFSIEKHDNEYHALIIAPLPEAPAPRDPINCLVIEREGAFAFPKAADMADAASAQQSAAHEAARAFFAGRAQAMGKAEEFIPEPSDAEREAAEEAEFEAQQRAAEAKANAAASEGLKNGKPYIRISSIESPTKAVWRIADEMVAEAARLGLPRPDRATIQEECIRRGVATGTARTQYQAWKKACDATAENAANAARLSAALANRQK